MTVKTLYIDLDNTLVDFTARLDGIDPSVLKAYENRYDEIPGIFALMPPVHGAIAAYRQLSQVFDTYILSTAPWKNPSAWQHKVEWVQLHLGIDDTSPAWKRLILSHHKDLNVGDFLVDDRPNNGAREFGERPGQEWIKFGAAPVSGNEPTTVCADWQAVVDYLLPLA